MPGSIKIDDGSGNYTILTNAGSLGSDKTITIPNTTGTMALTSDVPAGNPAFDVVDVWNLTADLSSPANPITSNLAQYTTGIATTIGTGMSVSSGIWTFPQTGIWKVTAQGLAKQLTNSVNAYIYIRGSNDNFSTNNILGLMYFNGPTTNIHTPGNVSVFVDIQDTTTDKVRFDWGGHSSGQFSLLAWSNIFSTGFQFERIADT
jgi:hypothetical protein